MTVNYTKSTTGSNANSGLTNWSNAKATLAGAVAIMSAGDISYASQSHAENAGGAAITLNYPGSITAPNQVICGNDGAAPPTAVSTAASVINTGAFTINVNGSVYFYGVTFQAATGAVSNGFTAGNVTTGNYWQKYSNCSIILTSTGSSARISLGGEVSAALPVDEYIFENTSVKFANAAQGIRPTRCVFNWFGGSVLSGSTALTVALIQPASGSLRTSFVSVDGVDLSNMGTSAALVSCGSGVESHCTFRNCKLPASWTGTLTTGSVQPGQRVSMYNCDNAATNYRLWIEDCAGTIKSETTLIRTGGANDGTTGLSWKVASNTKTSYPMVDLVTDEIYFWNDTTGTSKTATVEILRDSATALTNADIWMELQYFGSSGAPLSSYINCAVADPLTAPTNQSASTATWTTTGMSNPNTQKLQVTFVPQMKGLFYAKIHLTKASATVYIDPELTVV